MKRVFVAIALLVVLFLLVGCDALPNTQSQEDVRKTLQIGDKLAQNQPTPTDIEYSLERYNLIRRAYWVNGQRAKANSLPCPIPDMPIGHIVLIDHGVIFGKFIVEGKVSSLQNWLTPVSEYYEGETSRVPYTYPDGTTAMNASANKWIADTDGTYGNNDTGIYFWTVDKKYFEWKGNYIYTDVPMIVTEPVIQFQMNTEGE